jgi:hypothetical protein
MAWYRGLNLLRRRLCDSPREELALIDVQTRANIRRRIDALNVELANMAKLDQRWKGKYHSLAGELRALEDVEGGNYD